jgi:small-conductance mechanosensitive channel
VAINRALAEAGIEIPFPQRDLHIKSVAEGARTFTASGETPPTDPARDRGSGNERPARRAETGDPEAES